MQLLQTVRTFFYRLFCVYKLRFGHSIHCIFTEYGNIGFSLLLLVLVVKP